MILASFLLAALGLAAIGLSQPQHHDWVFHRQPSRAAARVSRWGGLALIAISLLTAMRAWGPAFGAVGWAGLLSLAAFALLLARTFLPQPPQTRR